MSWRRSLAWGAALGGLALVIAVVPHGRPSPAAGTTGDGTTQDTGPVLPTDPPDYDFAKHFAEDMHIPLADARQAVTDSGAIATFNQANQTNENFGSVWVTYNPYVVHLRLPRQDDGKLEADLQGQVPGKVEIVYAGPNAQTLNDATTVASELGVNFSENFPEGFLDVWSDPKPLDGKVDPALIRIVDPPVDQSKINLLAAEAGEVDWRLPPGAGYYQRECTVGFTYVGPGYSGFATAGHCHNGNTYVNGFYSNVPTNRAESCSPDYQLQDFQYSPTPFSGAHDIYHAVTVPMQVGGGLYIGQPTRKIGMDINGAHGSNTGTVDDYTTITFPAQDDCNYTHTQMSIATHNDAAPGDSGGPLLLVYNNQYFLGGLTTGGVQGSWSFYAPIWFIPIPSGAHICNLGNLC